MASSDKILAREGKFYVREDPHLGKIRGLDPWAVENGIITGKEHNTLDPKGSATRAEIATVLMRFVKRIAEN